MKDENYGEMSKKDERKIRRLFRQTGRPGDADGFIQRNHVYVVAERANDMKEFHAHQQCPACGKADFHGMARNFGKHTTNVIRICNDCEFEWLQE
jgi:uncharacterized protein YcsI (UPF0317 family)